MSTGALGEPGRLERLRNAALGPTANRISRWSEQVALVPVLLYGWGAARFGEWLTLSALVGVLSLLDLGVHHRAITQLTRCYAREDGEEYTRLLHLFLGWSLVLAAGAMLLVLIGAAFVPWPSLFAFETTARGATGLVVLLLGLQTAGAVPFGLLVGLYRSIGEPRRGERVIHTRRGAWFALTVAGVLLGGGLVVVAALQLASLAGAAWWVLRDLRRLRPGLPLFLRREDWRRIDWRSAKVFVQPGLLTFGVRSAAVLTLQGSTLVVGLVLGATSAAIFVTLRTLALAIRPLCASVTHALWPELTKLEIKDRRASLRAAHALAVKGVTAFSLAAALVLHHLAPWIVGIWTFGRIEHDPWLFGALLALMVLQTPWITSSQFLLASEQRRLVVRCRLAAVPLGLGLAALSGWTFGTTGAVFGLLAGEALACGWLIPRATCYLLGQKPIEHLTGVILPAVVIGLAGATFGRALEIPLWSAPLAVRAPLVGLAMGALVLFVSWKGWFEGWERKRLHDLVVGDSLQL